jgi:hypothetical protein
MGTDVLNGMHPAITLDDRHLLVVDPQGAVIAGFEFIDSADVNPLTHFNTISIGGKMVTST